MKKVEKRYLINGQEDRLVPNPYSKNKNELIYESALELMRGYKEDDRAWIERRKEFQKNEGFDIDHALFLLKYYDLTEMTPFECFQILVDKKFNMTNFDFFKIKEEFLKRQEKSNQHLR